MGVRLNVEGTEEAYENWCLGYFGQQPEETMAWNIIEKNHEVLFLLCDRVVAVIIVEEDNKKSKLKFTMDSSLTILLEHWNPGSVQAHRQTNGRIKLRFRRDEINFSAMLKSPHWIAAHIEEWLMVLRGGMIKYGSKVRRVNKLKRELEAVRRMLEQGSLDRLKSEVELIGHKITITESNLSGTKIDV